MPSGPSIDTFDQLVGRVLLHNENAGEPLVRTWLDWSWRDVQDRRRPWSWKVRRGQFILPAVTSTGTVTTTINSDRVTGIGTAFTNAHVGQQFRIGNSPLYTINYVFAASGTDCLQLSLPWGDSSRTGSQYEVYRALVEVPDDFHSFVSVINPRTGYQMGLGAEAREVDQVDAQRTSAGEPFMICSADYTETYSGTVGTVLQVKGSGPDPVAGGTYTGVNDAVFVVECTLGGASGVATYQWRKDTGTTTTGLVTSTDPVELQDGVAISFPTGTYVLGDIWIVSTTSKANPGSPRYEPWPHVKSASILTYLYECRMPDISELGYVPRYITGEVLTFGAMKHLCAWKGRDEEHSNPLYDLQASRTYERWFNERCGKLEQLDDDVYPADVSYYRERGFDPRWWAWQDRDRDNLTLARFR